MSSLAAKAFTFLLPATAQPPPFLRHAATIANPVPTIAPAVTTIIAATNETEPTIGHACDEQSSVHLQPSFGGERITEEWLRSLPESHCLWQFKYVPLLFTRLISIYTGPRVTADEILEMVTALRIPDDIRTPGGHCFDGLEALAITLARFRSPGDQHDLAMRFRRTQPAISEIFNWVCTYIDETWEHLLGFDSDSLLSPSNLEAYARAIYAKGAPVETIWGFIDCTIRRICRPTWWQRVAYNGYKKYHALKYQGIVLPNGIFGHLFGPWEGRNHDPYMLEKSGLMGICSQRALREAPESTPREERYLQLYGDPAYGINRQILCPFAGPVRTEAEKRWNDGMAHCRIAVEHGFQVILGTWPYLRAWWKMRINASPIGHQYRTAVLLTNALTCLHGNQISEYFAMQPPALSDYFHSHT